MKKGMNAAELARALVEQGARTVVAGGGDGTIRAVAEGLAGTGAALGVLPVGTLNHFARDLEIPLEVSAAAGVVREGTRTAVDVAEVNGRVFINNAILGLYPAFRRERVLEEQDGAEGAFAIVGAALKVFRDNPALLFRMTIDGQELTRHSPLVVIANNEHKMTGYELGTRERMDTGRLWIYVMHPRTRAGLARTFLEVVTGRLRREEAFEVFTAREATVETGRRQVRVSLDGEIFEIEAPLRFRSRHRALKVIVPRET